MKKYITVWIFVIFIFAVGVFSVINLGLAYKQGDSQKPQGISAFEGDFKNKLFLRTKLIETHGFTQSLIGNDYVEDAELGGILKTKWGQLTSLPKENDLSEFRGRLDKIVNACDENDIQPLYFQAPFKILPGYEKSELPLGFSTAANENADNIISLLESRGVDVFDFRRLLEDNNEIPAQKLFFNTDHHWRIETAFFAFSKAIEYLSDKYDYCSMEDVQFLSDKKNYTFTQMDNCYLGSWGRRVGVGFAGLDDFTYITPNFDTDFSIKRIAGAATYETSGDFYNVIMNPKRVEKEKYGASDEEKAAGYGMDGIYTDLYSVYMDGYVSEMQVLNNKNKDGGRILIFHDSFGFPFSSFMCLSSYETRIIDLRNWHEDIGSYISEYKPDSVIMIYNPDQ